jgi:hypothetical protein
VGNNTFDHNLGYLNGLNGLYFNGDPRGLVVIADRGRGIQETLKRVRPEIHSDEEAVRIAFTERSPAEALNKEVMG